MLFRSQSDQGPRVEQDQQRPFRVQIHGELRFIYYYPDIAAKVMTVTPYYNPTGELQKRVESGIVTPPRDIVQDVSHQQNSYNNK